MGLPTTGARKLTVSHMALAVKANRKQVRQLAANADIAAADDHEDQVTPLGRDEMKLYSYYRPSLEAGDYVIEVTQHVTSGSQSLTISNTRATDSSGTLAGQVFEVVVPRFTLDRNLVNSYYPPDGGQDEGRILPHISFNDPHYPWEIDAGVTANMSGIIDSGRAIVPWVALLVFDPAELRLPDLQTIQGLNIPGIATDADMLKQNPNGSFSMKVSEYFNIPQTSRVNYEAGYVNDPVGLQELKSITDVTSVIFPTKTLLGRLFSTQAGVPGEQKADLEALKYLAHVRNINTVGCPEAGAQDEGIFSIVVSSRTGTWNSPQPQTQVCHLVSIEHLDSTIPSWPTAPMDENRTERVGVISLFSWIYTSMPPNPINFITTVRNLYEGQQMLRTNDQARSNLEAISSPGGGAPGKAQAAKVLAERLRLGYTISRWRTQSGEETAAFNRSPLVPVPMPPTSSPDNKPWPDLAGLVDCSNTSQNYQILDPQTGFMDLTYSSAWQTGKLLAISDTVFSSALMRFRSAIHNSTADATRMDLSLMSRRGALIQAAKTVVNAIQQKSVGQTGLPQRFRPVEPRHAIAGMKSSSAAFSTWNAKVRSAISTSTGAGPEPIFNDFNFFGPNNNEWAIIHNWLTEKLLLGGIPPHYLLPEPSFLPAESIRFFYIDDFWLDCLLDGALSVANHLDSNDDVIRREIKKAYNVYLRTVVLDAGFKPQIPSYGFLIRSQLIKAIPDLRITVTWETPDNRHPVCRWTRWDDQTLMALLDRQPQELAEIRLEQPQHQKRFALGSSINQDSGGAWAVNFPLRQLYTQNAPVQPPANTEWPALSPPIPDALSTSWLSITTRGLEVRKMALDIHGELATHPDMYTDTTANSVELGLELNDPCYYFSIKPPQTSTMPSRDRQLYIRDPPAPTPSPHTTPPPAPTPTPSTVNPPPPQLGTLPPPPAPNNQLNIQPWPHTSTTIGPSSGSALPTLQTRFDLLIFADYNNPPTRFAQANKYAPTDYLATQNIYYYDLVFSIRKKTTASNSQFQLLKIVIDIPIATNPPNTHTEALLTPTYDGPGLRMLSNQRFVPFLFNDDPGLPLHVELVPRSADDGYAIMLNDGKTREVGFRLAEANVSPVVVQTFVDIDGEQRRQQRGVVEITMTEWYKTAAAPGGAPVSSVYRVVKRSVQDDHDLG
jgi:hypothetical protein